MATNAAKPASECFPFFAWCTIQFAFPGCVCCICSWTLHHCGCALSFYELPGGCDVSRLPQDILALQRRMQQTNTREPAGCYTTLFRRCMKIACAWRRSKQGCNVFVWCADTGGCDTGGSDKFPYQGCQLKSQPGLAASSQPEAWARGPGTTKFVSGGVK